MVVPAALSSWRSLALLTAVLIGGGAAFIHPDDKPAEDARRADAARLMNDLMSGKALVGGPFTLEDQYGKRRSLADFRGKPVLLYFGYTFCPDVCPTDLAAMAQAIRTLDAAGKVLQPIFVTLDPERDTREILRNYAAAFHPRFVALRGSEEEVRRVATAYKIYFEKVRPPGSSVYLIDHMAFVFLLDRDGRYVAFFPPGTTAERMAVMVGEALAHSG
ncbi:MAG TPA: SCO family protein [Steroidobacteraceae bacterium]|nr:SCO family protein [Steroidobacteraceae bacterium]